MYYRGQNSLCIPTESYWVRSPVFTVYLWASLIPIPPTCQL